MTPKCLLLLALGRLLFDISHAADKTVGFRRFFSKTTKANTSYGTSRHGNKQALFSRRVSICFLLMLAGQGGVTPLFV